jgi:hypothetical protein
MPSRRRIERNRLPIRLGELFEPLRCVGRTKLGSRHDGDAALERGRIAAASA